jgi:Na+/H+ antiporter NhaD/arsenite permease-like protein
MVAAQSLEHVPEGRAGNVTSAAAVYGSEEVRFEVHDEEAPRPVEKRKSLLSEAVKHAPTAAQVGFSLRRGLKIAGAIFLLVVFIIALIGKPSRIFDEVSTKANIMSALFLVGLVLVVLEDHVGVNKAAVMLMISASMWTYLAVGFHPHESTKNHEALKVELEKGLTDVGAIILFLLPAMGVVESIDHFDGFAVVTRLILQATRGSKDPLLPILCLLSFFLSAIIDNLTATIVSLKLLRHVAGSDRHLRHAIGGLVVIAANAGGAWSPVGDVTTTMLWLADKISVTQTILWLFLPSLVAGVSPMLGIWWDLKRHDRQSQAAERRRAQETGAEPPSRSESFQTCQSLPEVTRAKVLVLVFGLLCIFMVPVLKMVTGLPPYMGMLLALGILWFITDTTAFHRLAHLPRDEQEASEDGTPRTPTSAVFAKHQPGSVVDALHKMDLTGLLFFAGVLLAVGALDTAGVLDSYATLLNRLCAGSAVAICSLLGVSSAVVDNVPLVQASINMFGKAKQLDDPFWQLMALAAGTGGSILSVGSIAGVTLMTMEGVGYLWYCRRVSIWAALGFAAGIGTYQLERLAFA